MKYLAVRLLMVAAAAVGVYQIRWSPDTPTTPAAETATVGPVTLYMGGSTIHVVNQTVNDTPAHATSELDAAIGALVVAEEPARAGYNRDLFNYPAVNGDGCNTRDLVLIEETDPGAAVISGCWVQAGLWWSPYDNVTVTDPKLIEIDHVVALAEAWDSGASAWDTERLEQYGNDVVNADHLIAVTGHSNQEKSDMDPGEWRPANTGYWCTYATDWVNIKHRWQLTADSAEIVALREMAATCVN